MLQVETPDTFVLSTGRTETVRDFLTIAFNVAGIGLEYQGSSDQEVAVNSDTGAVIMRVNPKFYRPAEVEILVGDPRKARNILGWEAKTSLEQLATLMVEADVNRIESGHSF